MPKLYLLAVSYTHLDVYKRQPFTLLALRQEGYWGWSLFAVIWIAAVAGVWLSFKKMRKKDHLKTVCYLAMGWVVIIAFKPLLHVFRETGSMDVLYLSLIHI